MIDLFKIYYYNASQADFLCTIISLIVFASNHKNKKKHQYNFHRFKLIFFGNLNKFVLYNIIFN